ncbi:MAG: phosphoenolpyruvate--protein phosphotransferase [Gammaproteobacteria bacterium]|jgi:phosphotransferase system enzyme I (PtsP)
MASYTLSTIHKIVKSIDKSSDLSQALNNLVHGIHDALDVDVCSLYLSDNIKDVNILMATYGLNQEMVGTIEIPYAQGLVGLVTETGEPINVDNAPPHNRFKYIPEIGEDPYLSFLGVPISHHGEHLAVLVIQQQKARHFSDQEIAFLTTLATMIAGDIAFAKARGLIDGLISGAQTSGGMFKGVAGAPGVSIGIGVVVYNPVDLLSVPNRYTADPVIEESRFRAAIDKAVTELQNIGQIYGKTLPEADRLLFDAYALIASDKDLIQSTIDKIHEGNWAPGSLRETIESYAAQFESMENDYMKERANDMRDIGNRILGYLQSEEQSERDYPDNLILVGENLSPLDLALIPPEKLIGIVSGHGSGYSHLAILAHALGIPAVLGFSRELPLSKLDGNTLIIDGYQGQLLVAPNEIELAAYQELIEGEIQLTKELSLLEDKPAETPDKFRIRLYTNTGLLTGFSHATEVGTEGIGLYRTELPFMSKENFPSEDEQQTLYRQVIEAYAPRPVTLRTLDVGGDKVLPYFTIKEPNPFLGWRGIRMTLDHPEILLTQLRAMLKASQGYENLKILLPMISGTDELDKAIRFIHRAYEQVTQDGLTVRFPQIGAMIEVPSAVYQIESITKRVDFVSVGTNDLIQYLLAIDRNNELVAKMFDPLHPAVLRALSDIADATKKYEKHLSVCGEAAGDPLFAILLIAIGVDSLSLSAGDLPRIKSVIRTFTYKHARELWDQVLQFETTQPVRDLLTQEIDKHGLGGLIRPGK